MTPETTGSGHAPGKRPPKRTSTLTAKKCYLHDDLESSIVHMIRLTIDGLYYSKLLNIAPVSKEIMEIVFEQLLQMTRKDEFS
ncbi:hypothetical protein FOH38_20060 [Lysinibacillus fusiformis]|nr:hypothetical protein FOH38_20060 [Lysinibacillus fusiformis]